MREESPLARNTERDYFELCKEGWIVIFLFSKLMHIRFGALDILVLTWEVT